MAVAQPTLPSDFVLHFILMSPDPSSFRIHSRRPTSSPGDSFRSASAIVLKSKPFVRMVSFWTLQTKPPSIKNTEPWFPFRVTQPSAPSFMERHFARSNSPCSLGSVSSSTTSPTSNLAMVSLSSDTSAAFVMVVSFTTFFSVRSKVSMCSLVRKPSLSSSSKSKYLPKSSDSGASAPSSFSQLSKKARKDSLVTVSSSAQRLVAMSWVVKSFIFW
mmetsp:Transcript_4674/g.8522  ORF Transcript_4674/g.8522 Transcript_4674/m.8522 type:complete len:216 (+) Transcript_4674:192-839(+)